MLASTVQFSSNGRAQGRSTRGTGSWSAEGVLLRNRPFRTQQRAWAQLLGLEVPLRRRTGGCTDEPGGST